MLAHNVRPSKGLVDTLDRMSQLEPGRDVERVVAAHDIEQVLVAYFDRVDADDAEGAARLFLDDAEVEIMTGKRLRGRQRFARALDRVLAQYERTSHHVTNVVCTVEGAHARASAYVYAHHRMADTGEPWHLWARLEDRLARTEAGWRIAEHLLRGVDSLPPRADIPDAWYAGHPGRRVRGA